MLFSQGLSLYMTDQSITAITTATIATKTTWLGPDGASEVLLYGGTGCRLGGLVRVEDVAVEANVADNEVLVEGVVVFVSSARKLGGAPSLHRSSV